MSFKSRTMAMAAVVALAFPAVCAAADQGVFHGRQHQQQFRTQQETRGAVTQQNQRHGWRNEPREARVLDNTSRGGHTFMSSSNWRNSDGRIIHPEHAHRFRDTQPAHRWNDANRFSSHDVDRMQERQRARIEEGIRNGSLTRREADRLITEQRMIAREERAYRADGILTPYERADLWRDLNVASRNIFQETHDNQARYRW